ncbi:hypothetical protein SAY86_031692 [Trapa natans]|uniref:Uncharacterized protein n=1 Tax=Trapa natans TaxID=22666 RepID=A0AAN7LUM6_TRANT|nr:hypothetical protein SAY86_031692 [Trapa natans]
MHHRVVKSSLLDSPMIDHHCRNQPKQPLCPKPRRLGCTTPEVLMPSRCIQHSQPAAVDGRSGVLNLIMDKTAAEGRESTCVGCLPPCYVGSPPTRTDNPLIHDVQFIRQTELLSPLTRTKLSDKFGFQV